MKVQLDPGAFLPDRAHPTDAGADQKTDEYFNCTCPICGKRFHLKPYTVKKAKKHYCSKACHNKGKSEYFKGENNHQYGLKGNLNATWKSDRKVSRYGYIQVRCLDHPFRDGADFVFEHRLVAEKYLLNDDNSVIIDGKRYLSPEYIVHHINHNRQDNRVKNLEVMTKSEHSRLHTKENPMPKDAKTGRFVKRRRKMCLRVQLDEGAFLPERAYPTDAGADLRTPKRVLLPAHEHVTIDTGVHVEIPAGYVGMVKSKSGLMVKHGILTDGTVDSGYTSSIRVCLFNHGHGYKVFEPGEKIAQLVIMPIKTPEFEHVDQITGGERGDRGFGSTGK